MSDLTANGLRALADVHRAEADLHRLDPSPNARMQLVVQVSEETATALTQAASDRAALERVRALDIEQLAVLISSAVSEKTRLAPWEARPAARALLDLIHDEQEGERRERAVSAGHAYQEGRFGDDGICHASYPRPGGHVQRCYRPRTEHVAATPLITIDDDSHEETT